MRTSRIFPVAAAVVTIIAGCDEPAPEGEIVAQAGDYRLTVDQVVDLLVDEERLAADASVVRSLADYWIDYTLLAEAVDEDSTFSDLDLEPLVQSQLRQMMIFQLRDSVIQIDTFITEGELETLYLEEDPDVELRARHILLSYPLQATPAQRDSVRSILMELRARILAGAQFETIARQYSQDVGTAQAGGDLGAFGRGDMMAPFEEATLALQPGEISDLVETPLGLHLIRLDARNTRGFAEVAPAYRQRVQTQRLQAAESTFVVGLEAQQGPEVTDGAHVVTRETARNPGTRLSGRAARRPLIEWEGGSFTVGDLQDLLRIEPSGLRDQLANETDERVDLFLHDLARRELLVEQARSAGLQPPRTSIDSLVTEAGSQLREAARMLGFLDIDQAPGEPRELAIARAVEEALAANLTGAIQFVPLGMVGFELRERSSFAQDDTGSGTAILRIAALRANRSPSLAEDAFDTTGVAGDTIGQ